MADGAKQPEATTVDNRAIYLVIRRAVLSVMHIFDKKYHVSSLDK